MDNQMVPYAAIEIVSARHDRTMKRMCVAFVIAVCVMAICTTVMCAFWCKTITKNSDENTHIILEQIEELHSDG